MMKIMIRGKRKFVRVEEYSEEYDLNANQIMRVAVDNRIPLCDVVVAVDTTPVDQETEMGNVEWVPCVSIYIPEEVDE